jgi:hypothetical protein
MPQDLKKAVEYSAEGAQLVPRKQASDLEELLGSLPDEDKYETVLGSYTSKILQAVPRNKDDFEAILRLTREISDKAITVSIRAQIKVLDAAAALCEPTQIAASLRFMRSQGSVKAFGSAVPMLSNMPSNSKQRSSLLSFLDKLPEDERGREVVSASVTLAAIGSLVSLQLIGIFWDDAHMLANLLFLSSAGFIGFDVMRQQSLNVKKAFMGIERLFVQDTERECWSEAAAFLAAYMLGLPCFCYRPEARM